ncbi:MAG: hypothetical protein J6Q48_09735 [Bacteroidaceae bacterium]|nr:hypothetical protein [Bacteroidaceae bacterium]
MNRQRIDELLTQSVRYERNAQDATRIKDTATDALIIRSGNGFNMILRIEDYPELEKATKQILEHVIDIEPIKQERVTKQMRAEL